MRQPEPFEDLHAILMQLDDYARRHGYMGVSQVTFQRYPAKPQPMLFHMPGVTCKVVSEGGQEAQHG